LLLLLNQAYPQPDQCFETWISGIDNSFMNGQELEETPIAQLVNGISNAVLNTMLGM